MNNNKTNDKSSEGQNPIWPGEKALEPGTIKDRKRNEETKIPFVDSLPHKPGTTT